MLDAAANAPRGSQYANLTQEQFRNPKSETEIVAALHNDVTSSEWILAPMHRSWYEAILWTLGEHYLEWNQRTRRFQIRPVRLYVPRAVSNLIIGRVERGISLFKKSMPTVQYSPTSTSARDREAAENATGSIRFKDRQDRAESKKRDLAGWVVVTGTGYVMAREDKAAAERIKQPVTHQIADPMTGETRDEPVIDPATGEPQMDEIVMADEGMEVCAPFEIVPDWNARYPWEWRRYTHVRARTLDWVAREFGSQVRESIKPEAPTGIVGTMGYYQLKVLDIQMRASLTGSYGLPYGYGGAIADMRYMEDSVVVLTRYQLPSDENPDGRYLVVAGGKSLYDGPYPYGSRINLFTFRWSVLPGSIFGFGMVRNLISPQKRYNGISTQIDMIRKTMGNPWIFSDRKAQLSVDTQTTEPGHHFTYKSRPGIERPFVEPAHGSDADAKYQQETVRHEMDDIAGTEEVLRGVNPTGVTAGITIEHLTEQAVERFKPAIDENRDEFLRLYDMRIEIARQSNAWQNPRDVQMVGTNGRISAKALSAADITGSFSAEAEDTSQATISHAVQKQNIMLLVDKGFITAESERNRDLMRKKFGAQEFSEDVDLDRRRAEDENERMYMGDVVHVQPIDDTAVHVDTHTNEMKTDRFQGSPNNIKQNFYAHLHEHVAVEQRSQRQAAMEQVGAAGVMPSTGAGGPPPPPNGGMPPGAPAIGNAPAGAVQ